MNAMEEESKVKGLYVSPEVTVEHLTVEGPITASIDPTQVGPEWKTDDEWEPYDGDIWMPV